jgi:large subunit ribosomal protein L21
MYAIVESGGKQYRVSEGDEIVVEKLSASVGDKVELDKVLLLNDDKEVKVGTPYVDGAKVLAEVTDEGRGKKIVVFKYKAKKDSKSKQGHRQPYTTLKIESLTGAKKTRSRKKAATAEEKPAEAAETEVKAAEESEAESK